MKKDKQDIKVGDVVRVRSGSIKMCVSHVHGSGHVNLLWMSYADNRTQELNSVPIECVVFV